MSASTHSQERSVPSESARATSLAEDDDQASTHQESQPISALAIEVHHGKFGCAVFLEEEQQLLLCEDLPCDFALGDNDQPESIPNANAQPGQTEDREDDAGSTERTRDAGNAGNAADAVKAGITFGQPSYGVVESLLSQFQPDLIVLSSRCPESLLGMLQHFESRYCHETSTAEQRNGIVEVRSARDFQMALGLSSIEEATALGRRTASERASTELMSLDEESITGTVLLDAQVALSKSALSVSSAGPLLSSLRSKRDIGRSLSLVSLCLDDYLFVDENTLKSLSICTSDVHGFVHAKAGREGFSILAMLNLTLSKFSQPLLRRWIMLPLAKGEEIKRRHDAVELLVRQESTSEVTEIRSRLGELGGLPQMCFQVNMGVASVHVWSKLLKTCNAILRIRTALNTLDLTMSELLRELREQMSVDKLLQLADMIQETIDFEDSKSKGRTTVNAGVDPHLDQLRVQYAQLPVLLDGVASELRMEPAFRSTSRLHVVYFPQIGYLIVVPGGETVDMLSDTTLEQQFASEEAVYLKNSRMATMDQHLGDLASFITDREIEILDGLQQMLGECTPTLLASHAALSQLDCLIAFARGATLYDLRRPNLVKEQVIRLKGSRHALKALSDESFVPNDIDLRGGVGISDAIAGSKLDAHSSNSSGGQPHEGAGQRPEIQEPTETTTQAASKFSVMVLTGANSSGKSCLLQQAALAVFLCQCGSFVPATHAELGVFDKILTRMRQDESVASEGSSFTRELGRLHRAMAMSTTRSLVILDEVGRECRSDDGAGLFIATVYDFLERGSECPIVLSATHHLRAIEKHLPESLPIQRAHMQTILLPMLAEAYNSLTYLYRLKPGFAGTSHACHCARLCGVPESIVERADRICRIGLRAWHDSEAVRDENIVRRLLQLDLGNDSDEPDQQRQERKEIDDDAAKEMLEWVLHADDLPPSSQGRSS